MTLTQLRAREKERTEQILDAAMTSGSFAEAARRLGISRERVRQVARKAGLDIRRRRR